MAQLRSRLVPRLLGSTLILAALLGGSDVRAGSFDVAGEYIYDEAAVVTLGFEADDFDPEADRFEPSDAEAVCREPQFTVIQNPDALDGGSFLRLSTDIFDGCSERFLVQLPKIQASYRARLWARHGTVRAQMVINYVEEDRPNRTAMMGPTGRVTSDGWVELESNDFPVDGEAVERVYLLVFDVDEHGSEIDALEIVPSGDYTEPLSCTGVGDPACTEDEVCIHQHCRLGRLSVPPAPLGDVRHDMVDVLQSQLRVHFGGRKTRLNDLPAALDELDRIRYVEGSWQFWKGWAKAINLLHDWHTRPSGGASGFASNHRLNVCFIEGDADLTQSVWPRHPQFKDLLVSHVGASATHGINAGDRLVAVDGKHAIAWAQSLLGTAWSLWRADDDDVHAELAEAMRGLIAAYATSITVIHCNAGMSSCDGTPTTYQVADLPESGGGNVRCDNRPGYHFVPGVTKPGANHAVNQVYSGRIEGPTQQEAVYGMVWDSLWGPGVNNAIRSAFANFKANARGVLMDHRAGNGGTLDGAETATELVRPLETVLVFTSPIELAGFDGPATPQQGIALFNRFKDVAGMVAGSNDYDPDMPVALLLHRDGSASDFWPFAMKGASSKVRIFSPGPTAGAFSTFNNYRYWGGLSWQVATGDSIAWDGRALIGHGVEPDELVLQKQSDLLAGKDTIHEAALAWVLGELKP